jgi:uncharacterized protein YfaP (DUF2135 family)
LRNSRRYNHRFQKNGAKSNKTKNNLNRLAWSGDSIKVFFAERIDMRRLYIIKIVAIMLIIVCNSFAQGSNATFKFVIGDVQRLTSGQVNWQKASVRGKVFKGDRIKTALNSRVEIEMPDGSVIKVDQNTLFDVKEIKTQENEGADEMSFSLWVGDIWAQFKKVVNTRQKRTIESPSAVVAIRGTTLEINVHQDQTTTVSVEEGTVGVTSKEAEGEVVVSDNQRTVVKKGEAPTPPSSFRSPDDNSGQRGLVLQVNNIPVQQTDPTVLRNGVAINGRTAPGARVAANGIPLHVAQNGQFDGNASVQEGLNSIEIIAEKDGEKVSENMRVYVNTRKPQLRLSSPLVSGFLNKRDYSLSGAIFDETPVDKVKVIINGDEIAEIVGRGSFNRTIILQEGRNEIRVNAFDLANNSVEMSESIFLDTVKPIITITEPASTSAERIVPPAPPDRINTGRSERFTQIVRGVIIDPEPSSGLKRILINGKEVLPSSDGSFQTEIQLERGQNVFQIYAEDMAGNINRDNSRRIFIR